MSNYTIVENFTLPSHGLLYSKPVNPEVSLRCMTTRDEMRRLAPTKPGNQYKVMAEIIDDCLIEKPGISSYDMCIGDYQFLLYKLRVVTYGPKYNISITCPNCNRYQDAVIDLDTDLELLELTDFNTEDLIVHLPLSKKEIKLKVQTPRMLDKIEEQCAEFNRKLSKSKDPDDVYQDAHILYQVMGLIDTVDGEKLPEVKLEAFVDNLPIADANAIISAADKLNQKVGYGPLLTVPCAECGFDILTSFRITSEFFRPTLG